MPISGVGIDIISLPRFLSLVERRSAERLASRILCPQERRVWNSISPSNQNQKLRFLAVRWGVKEAAYKALQPHWRLTWKQLSFLNDPASDSRKPALQLEPGISGLTDVRLHASVSHDGDHIVAMVVTEYCMSNPCL